MWLVETVLKWKWVEANREGMGPTWDKMATEGMFPSALTICCATCVCVDVDVDGDDDRLSEKLGKCTEEKGRN